VRKLCFILLLLAIHSLMAQEKSGLEVLSDSTNSGYIDETGFGGPKTTGAQLQVNNQKQESYFRIPITVLKSWYETKQNVNKKTGIQYDLSYTAVYLTSSAVIDGNSNSKSTGGGRLDINFGWNLVGRKSGKNKGILFARLNSRHTYGSGTSPMFHGIFESGYYGLPAVGFSDYSFRMLELNWHQSLANNRLHFVIGKVDPTNYFNFHGIIVPWQHFLGYGSSVSGTVNWPNQGLGGVASYNRDKWYIMAGVHDIYGDLYNDGDFFDLGKNFDDGNVFTAVEVGFFPSFQERYFRKVSFTYWSGDPYTSAGGSPISSGSGMAFSAHWFFQDKFIPYARFGFSDGNGENAFYEKDIQIGHGLRFKSHDIFGTSFSWTETNISGTKSQMTVEVFYRFNLTDHLEITPDFQWIINPTLNSNINSLAYFGIRGRATL